MTFKDLCRKHGMKKAEMLEYLDANLFILDKGERLDLERCWSAEKRLGNTLSYSRFPDYCKSALIKHCQDRRFMLKQSESNYLQGNYTGAMKKAHTLVSGVMEQNNNASSPSEKVYISASYFYSEKGQKLVMKYCGTKSINRTALRNYLTSPAAQEAVSTHHKEHRLDKDHNQWVAINYDR